MVIKLKKKIEILPFSHGFTMSDMSSEKGPVR